MPSTLAQLEAQVAALLMDSGNAIFSTSVIDAALRMALSEYSDAAPLAMETVLTLPGDGREIALSSLSGLVNVTEAWWPFDSDATSETWPPNRVRGFRLWWDDASPVLFLDLDDGASGVHSSEPQGDDEIRIWYTKPHTIQNLDSASTTTVGEHESLIVRGAAGLACLGRAADVNETAVNMAVSTPNYAALANRFLNQMDFGFYPRLYVLRSQSKARGRAFSDGWKLDKYE